MTDQKNQPATARYTVRKIGQAFWLCKPLLRPHGTIQNPIQKFASRAEAHLIASLRNSGRIQPTESEIHALLWQPTEARA